MKRTRKVVRTVEESVLRAETATANTEKNGGNALEIQTDVLSMTLRHTTTTLYGIQR